MCYPHVTHVPLLGLSLHLSPHPKNPRARMFLVRGEEFCFLMCYWLSRIRGEFLGVAWIRGKPERCLPETHFQTGVTVSSQAASLCVASGPGTGDACPMDSEGRGKAGPCASKSLPQGLLLQLLPTVNGSRSVKAESHIQRVDIGELTPRPAQL